MTYAALTEALEIFSSKATPQAPIGLRFAAGTLDLIAVGAILTFVMPYVLGRLVGPVLTVPLLLSGPDLATDYFGHAPAWLLWLFPPVSEAVTLIAHPRFGMASAIAQAVIALGYFIALEGIWGRSIGKALCGLRVVDINGDSPELSRVACRSLPFVAVASGLLLVFAALNPGGVFPPHSRRLPFFFMIFFVATPLPLTLVVGSIVETLAIIPACLLTFMTARRDNEYRGVHELWSGTRAVTDVRRDLDRPGRLRWLAGSRTGNEPWDAYEAVVGSPFVHQDGPEPWVVFREWVRDLTCEIHAALKEGSMLEF